MPTAAAWVTAGTWAGRETVGAVWSRPSCWVSFRPQVQREPSARITAVWLVPALTAVTGPVVERERGRVWQLGAGLVGGVSLAAVAQLAVDVAPPQPEGTVRPEGGGVVAAHADSSHLVQYFCRCGPARPGAVPQLTEEVVPPGPQGLIAQQSGGGPGPALTAAAWSKTFAGADRLSKVPSPS